VGTGHIHIHGEPNYVVGFPLTKDLVVTAGHVVSGRRADDLEYEPHGLPRVKVLEVEITLDLDIAVLRLAEPVPAVRGWRSAREGEAWYIRARLGERGDPLSGTVSVVGWSTRLISGQDDVSTIRLIADDNSGDYRGYSGGPVTDRAGDVLGVQVEQRARNSSVGGLEASNVLYATPIEEVCRVLGLEGAAPVNERPAELASNLKSVLESAQPNDDAWTRTEEFDHPGLEGVMFGPDGSYLVTWGNREVFAWPIPTRDGRLAVPEVSCPGTDPVPSGDGRWMAVRRLHHVTMCDLTAPGRLEHWTVQGSMVDAESWERSYEGRSSAEAQIRAHAVSPDGRLLSIAPFGGPGQLIRVDDGHVESLPPGILLMAFSPDGYRFAYGSKESYEHYSIELRELEDCHILEGRKQISVDGLSVVGISHLSFDSSGRWLISGVRGTTTEDRISRLSASYSKDRETVPIDRGFVCAHASRNGMNHGFLGLNSQISNLVVGADRFLAVTSDQDPSMRIWLIGSTGSPVLAELDMVASSLSSDPAGRFLAVAGDSTTAHVFDLHGDGRATVLPHQGGRVRTVAVSREGAVATGTNHKATVWAPRAPAPSTSN
jgi:hypothetical protein